MGSRWLFVLSLLLVTIAQAQTGNVHTHTANGRTFTCTLRVLDPPVAIQFDPSQLNQDTAVNCMLLFMLRLDFSGAAAITTDPESTVIGSQEFHDLFALGNDHAAGKVEFK